MSLRSNSATKNLRGMRRAPSSSSGGLGSTSTIDRMSSSISYRAGRSSSAANTLSYHDVGAVKKKLTVTERKLAEQQQREASIGADVGRLGALVEEAIVSLEAVRRDEQELVLRVVEARLLHDGLVAQHTESSLAMVSARRRLHDECGNSTIKAWTLEHLRTVQRQRCEEVDELEEALEGIEAQILAAEAEAALLAVAIGDTERIVEERREDNARQESMLGVVVDSVANALEQVVRDSSV